MKKLSFALNALSMSKLSTSSVTPYENAGGAPRDASETKGDDHERVAVDDQTIMEHKDRM